MIVTVIIKRNVNEKSFETEKKKRKIRITKIIKTFPLKSTYTNFKIQIFMKNRKVCLLNIPPPGQIQHFTQDRNLNDLNLLSTHLKIV